MERSGLRPPLSTKLFFLAAVEPLETPRKPGAVRRLSRDGEGHNTINPLALQI
jgi:hypothetical protein